MQYRNIEKKNYFLESTISYYNRNLSNRLKFLKEKENFFYEISNYLSKIINETDNVLFFCCGNSLIHKKIVAKKKVVQDIDKKFLEEDFINESENIKIEDFKDIVIADIEHQKNPLENLKEISKNLHDDSRVILVSKSLIWSIMIKIFKMFYKEKFISSYNFLPLNYLNNIFDIAGLEIIRSEKIIFFPFNIFFLTKLFNQIFRLPILRFFCMINITVLKKRKKNCLNLNKYKISVIIPCKNEEENIALISGNLTNLGLDTEYLFGDDKSTDSTSQKIKDLNINKAGITTKLYEGPGICKSKNVFTGVEVATGDIVLIYDADCTVNFTDIKKSLEILTSTNADFINCTRMILPQKKDAMKIRNFFGNIIFAYLFSILFNKRVTDTLCGTKIFYKKDWVKIKNSISFSGVDDLWGDFDLLIGAYRNNLKIVEVPVNYDSRVGGVTKMTSVLNNAIRMFIIVIKSYYILRIK